MHSFATAALRRPLFVLLGLALVAGCAAPSGGGGSAANVNKPVATSAPAAPAATSASAKPAGAASPAAGAPAAAGNARQINMGTATVGGLYYPIGAAIAKVWTAKVPNVNATAQATAGTPQNINLMEKKDADVAIGQAGVIRDAYKGTGDFNGRPQTFLRAITYLYPNVVQFVARDDAGVKTIADFKGKKFVPGAAGSANEVNSREIFDIYGLDYKNRKDVEVNFTDVNASVDLMKNRQADGAQLVGGIPFGALIDLWTSTDVHIVPINEPDKLAALKQKYPAYYPFTIPAGTYEKQKEPVQTVAVANMLIVREDLPEDLVYNLTKAIFENLDTLVATHKAASTIQVKDAQNGLTVPLHPGAERYLKEKGETIRPIGG